MLFPLYVYTACGCVFMHFYAGLCVCGRTLSTDFTLFRSSFIQPVILVHLVSMELICLCLCSPVYSMGRSVGGLERLHHLFLPGRRRPVQGKTFEVSACCFLQLFRHPSVSQVGWLCLYCVECFIFLRSCCWWGSEASFAFLCTRVTPPTL